MKNERSQALKLWKAALRVRKNAYAPYSKFKVGAAGLTKKGILSACNVENVSLGGTICAERFLIGQMIAEAAGPLEMICVVTQMKNDPKAAAFPCGLCLQVLSETCSPSLVIWTANPKGLVARRTLNELLPGSFKRGAF
jgi:cytidine deaminase